MRRLYPITSNSVHHIYNKSIHHFQIFNSEEEYTRMMELISFYQYSNHKFSFSTSKRLKRVGLISPSFSTASNPEANDNTLLVEILAFCLMPTHMHFVLKQTTQRGIELFIGRISNAYARYFNLRHNRRGPLWEHRFGNTPIQDEAHLAKAIDYVLTNPVKDNIVSHPSQWKYSSYHHSNPRG